MEFTDQAIEVGSELSVAGGSCRRDGAAYPACRVSSPGHACGELLGPLASEDRMCMGIDEAWQHASVHCVGVLICCGSLRGIADPGDDAVIDDQCCVSTQADEALTELRIHGEEFTDAADAMGCHGCIIGIRTSRSSATSHARSYPASTCRITPIPGSFVSTRCNFSAASGVPSATLTCPA